MPISAHIKAVREKLGHGLLATTAAAISIFDQSGRLLLALDAERGLWTLPGGAVDPCEPPSDAAVRECFEETGLLVQPHKLIGVFGGPDFLIKYPNGDVTYYTVVAFEASIVGGVLNPDGDEIAALRFVDQSEWGRLSLTPSSRIISQHSFARQAGPYFKQPSWRPAPATPGS
jgi:8-oxo-dGTP pyrophosphatase MutT (NUDIX family)